MLAITILAWYKSEHRDEYFKIMDPLGWYDENDYSIAPTINKITSAVSVEDIEE